MENNGRPVLPDVAAAIERIRQDLKRGFYGQDSQRGVYGEIDPLEYNPTLLDRIHTIINIKIYSFLLDVFTVFFAGLFVIPRAAWDAAKAVWLDGWDYDV